MVQQSNLPESQPQSSPEQAFPPMEAGGEVPSVELQPEEGQERQAEQQVERDKPDAAAAAMSVSTDSSADTDQDDTADGLSPASSFGDSPDIANDVDVIEKAWVDKAKKIIKDTRDDPRAQEEAFERLQIEYHKKRYGRDIKATR